MRSRPRSRPLDRRQRFCNDCQGLDSGQSTLCPECGGTWSDPGYCPICERYWPMAEGTECPKHGIAMESGPDDRGRLKWSNGQVIDWVTVESYPHPFAAQAARLRLDAEGIPTFLDGERMGDNTLYQNATGGVKLQVPRSLQSDARILLAQSWDAPMAGDDGEDEEWDEPIRVEWLEAVDTGEEDDPRLVRRPMGLVGIGLILLAAALIAWWWRLRG